MLATYLPGNKSLPKTLISSIFVFGLVLFSSIVFSTVILSPLGINMVNAQSLDNLGKVFESKQERYRREDQERKLQAAKDSQIQDSIRKQQAEIRAIEEEKRRLLSGNGAAQPPSSNNSSNNNGTQVYVVAQCAPCLKTIGVLDTLQVPYTIRQVDTSISTQQLYIERFGRGEMPVVDSANGVIRGYRPEQLKLLFNKSCGSRSVTSSNTARQEKKSLSSASSNGSSTRPPDASLPEANRTEPKSDFDVSPTINQ